MGGAFLCRSEALLRLLVMVTRVLHTIIRDDPRCPYGDSVSARKRRDGAEWLSEPSKQVEDRVFRMKADVAPINSMAPYYYMETNLKIKIGRLNAVLPL